MNKKICSFFCLAGCFLITLRAGAQLPANPWNAEEFNAAVEKISEEQEEQTAENLVKNYVTVSTQKQNVVNNEQKAEQRRAHKRSSVRKNKAAKSEMVDTDKLQKDVEKSIDNQKKVLDKWLKKLERWKNKFVKDCQNVYRACVNALKNCKRKLDDSFRTLGRELRSLSF